LGPQSIFVAKNGDWKIGAFDLACNLSSSEDFSFLKTHVKLLQRPYIAPERENFINGTTCSELTTSDASGAGKGLAVNWHADIYSVAQCMKLSFERLGLEEPAGLSKYYPRMLSAEPKRRPTASQMEKCPVFSNDNIKLLISLGELSLRAPFETLDILKQLTSQVANIPQPVCLHKILPA
jgi:serine/threonine protein kinase